jgi:hypothetical protein
MVAPAGLAIGRMAFAEEFASGFAKDLPGRRPNDAKCRVRETAVRRVFGRYEKVKLPVLEQLGPDAAVNAAAQMLDERVDQGVSPAGIELQFQRRRTRGRHAQQRHGEDCEGSLDSRKPVRSWPLPPSTRFIPLAPDGRRLLVLCDRAEESLWINLETGEIQEAHIPAGYYSFNFSPDGGLFGVATEPHVAHVWKVPSFEPFADLRGHMMGPKGIGFSADARRIATTGSGAQGVIFWDAEYQLELLTLPAPGGLIKSSAFSSDGRYYGAGDETILTVWMAPTFDEIAAAEAMEKAKGRQP